MASKTKTIWSQNQVINKIIIQKITSIKYLRNNCLAWYNQIVFWISALNRDLEQKQKVFYDPVERYYFLRNFEIQIETIIAEVTKEYNIKLNIN
jgi:hypothetical protein